jgi:hypothetical protein
MVDATERLTVLLKQEKQFYGTSDFLARMQVMAQNSLLPSGEALDADGSAPPSPKKRKSEDGSNADAASSSSTDGSASVINKHWREKICEWAYQGMFAKIANPKIWFHLEDSLTHSSCSFSFDSLSRRPL